MIDFIIPVRDKEISRLKRCIKSLKSDITGTIYVVDYGSEKPIKVSGKNVEVIRYNKNKYFNKSHALNLGIRQCKNEYVATIDCDIILGDGFIDRVRNYLTDDILIISRNIRRIDREYIGGSFETMWKLGRGWTNNGEWPRHAVGGIQIFSRKWINKIHGYNEHLVFMGGMDTRIFDQAIMDSIPIIDINYPILHQEHSKTKDRQFSGVDTNISFNLLVNKSKYLEKLRKIHQIRNKGRWGQDKPNQDMFLRDCKTEKEEKSYTERFIKAIKLGKPSFKFKGEEIKIFK